MSPTQRTLAALKAKGCIVGNVERFQRFAGKFGVRQDLFGFIDLIALDVQGGTTIGVQSTGTSFSGHEHKILEECRALAALWLLCGNRLQLWGWRKLKKKRGGKATYWAPRVKEYSLEDFIADP